MAGLGQFVSGIFGGNDKPYRKYAQEMEENLNQAKQYYNPFYEAGTSALPQYQQSLDEMKDPQAFFKKIMGGYQESPWAKFQQEQGQRALTNSASAGGLIGSTPFMQAGQDYTHNIGSQDMQQFLQNILGIKSGYQSGLGNLISGGQNAAQGLAGLQQSFADPIASARYGGNRMKNMDRGNIISGALDMTMFGNNPATSGGGNGGNPFSNMGGSQQSGQGGGMPPWLQMMMMAGGA